ncbi:MAG: L-2-hydroxyglutarate oxidase [Rhodospirillales bacterium]|nr:L-2-hydroxyglutarate oxidase [Rhodospirillales bacterium]MBT4041498.1 L-2-hydroxyglutarate oxidase [Rhodospirillales bacterium]MBT4627503.1 L-2-hydroxyglutarate oxidase [Rhodospirillales bacterium]MBT5351003.1 L-2-hydroxyglutarate oxidase [Rhodospirillales bacterium]MBT5520942.1 L-2-hydroxyglutarate oxidase [Rhodospirillales bacterium]
MIYDYAIVGGGIVGVSTAWQLKQRLPDARITVIEKEDHLSAHQTGHNSGVIHAGVYYQPGSMKALFCRRGVDETIRFSRENNIPFEQCGKLIVATDAAELSRMEDLVARCRDNDIDSDRLSAEELNVLEPRISGVGAILAKTTGIADYPAICRTMAAKFEDLGGEIKLGLEVTAVREMANEVVVQAGSQEIHASHLIVCAGIMSDRLADMLSIDVDFSMVPFRGEYYRLPPEKNNIVKHLIYPVPDPALPFLGVHLTRMIEGCVTVGPNAVLGFSREGYAKGSINGRDIVDMVRFGGFWKLMKQHMATGISEMKNSLSKSGYLERCRKYCPELTLDDLQPYPAGIRAMAVTKDGQMIHDFLFADTARTILVCNAPSPAATSAIPIGEYIVNKAMDRFH